MAYTDIDKSTNFFNSILYTGTGSSNALTGVGFKPDWVWIKCRNEATGHNLYDVVRGVTKYLSSNSQLMQGTSSTGLTAFGTDGFTVGSSNDDNKSSNTYVSWNWLGANGTASNSDGSITTTVSANTTSGFSIIDFTGNESSSSIGHGLGVAPSMFIMKRYTDDGYASTGEWYVYHKSLASDKYLRLQSNAAVATNDGSLWNTSTPVTSSVINIGSNANSNHTGNKTIVYAFAQKKGYSKFGVYKGNGNANGTFVHTGFRPAMIILKDSSSGSGYNWIILDNKRDPSNGLDKRLQPSTALAEYTDVSNFCNFNSNGFKWTGSQANWNASGVSYIYMAFAENPFVTSTGIPVPAR